MSAFKLGLRSKISLIIFASLSVCFLLLGLVIYWVTQRQVRDTIEQQMFEVTKIATGEAEKFMEDAIEEVEGIAQDKILRAAILSWNIKQIDPMLESYVSGLKKVESFFVFDKAGYVRALTTPNKATLGHYYGHRAYFQRAMKSQQTALGDPVIGGSTRKSSIHIAVPIKDSRGEIKALLVAAITLHRLSQHFEMMRVGKSGFIILVAPDGKILAHADRAKLFTPITQNISFFGKMQEKTSGFLENPDSSGKNIFYAWTSLPKYGWILIARRPTQEFYEPLETARRLRVGGIFLSLLVAVAACIYFVNRYVLEPIKSIQSNLSGVAAGKVPPKDLIQSGDELQLLAENISEMANSLKQSYESLSKRNRELSVLNTIAAVSSQSLDIQEILETTLDKALELMNLRVGNVRLYDPGRKKLVLAAHRGVTPQYQQSLAEIDIEDEGSYAVQALTKGQPVLVKDIRKDSRLKDVLFPKEEPPEDCLCLVCVPMRVKDKIIGSMGFISREGYCFVSEELDIFTSIGNQLAVAIEKAALLRAEREAREKERERANELGMLFTTGRLLTTSLQLDEILKYIVETTSFLFEVNKCILMLKDDQGYLNFAYTKGIHQDFLDIGKLAVGESLSGWVASRGEHLYVPQMDEDPRFKFPELARMHGFYSFLGVPLKAKDEVIGVLNIYTNQLRAFTAEEIQLLSTVGDYAAIAIQQARDRQKLEAQIMQRHRELSTINAISSTLSRSLDLNKLLDDAIDMIKLVMNADKAAVFLKENGQLRLVVHRGFSPAMIQRVELIPADECTVWNYLQDQELRVYAKPPQEIFMNLLEFEQENIVSALDVRLSSKRENLGFLTVFYSHPREFGEEERNLLVSIGHQIAAALENAQLYQRTLHSYHQLQVVSEINNEISMQLDLESLLFLVARRAAELIGADASIIGLCDPRSGRVYPRGWFNMPEEINDAYLVFPEAEWRAMDWLQKGLLWNESRDLPLEGIEAGSHPVGALMVQPLHAQEEFLGLILLLNFDSHKSFQEEDKEVLALLAGQGAVAIQNAQYIKEITDLDQQRENYLSNVSHELRTPITLIRGYSEAIKDGAIEEEEEQQKSLEIIIKECERLTRLVEGLLLLPRLEMDDPQKTLHLSLLDLSDLLESCLQVLKPELEEKRIAVEKQLPLYPKIWADYDMIFQVIFNLLNNAVKFIPQGGKIQVRGEAREQEIEFMVRDSGPGIPPELVERVFDKFYMIDSGLTRKQRGMGLGLYIVKKIVELHGGRIWVESQVGMGTSFHVALPKGEA